MPTALSHRIPAPPAPPPVTGVRATVCRACPVAHHPPDPESADLERLGTREQIVGAAYTCGWARGKLCRGFCERHRLTAAEVVTAIALNNTDSLPPVASKH